MHQIKPGFLSSDNWRLDGPNLENTLFHVRLLGTNDKEHRIRNSAFNMLVQTMGMPATLTLELTDKLKIKDSTKELLTIPFEQIDFVQFGILDLMGGVMTVPTSSFYLLVYVQQKDGQAIGLVDNALGHYPKYKELLSGHDLTIEDPFDIEHVITLLDDSGNAKLYNYLQKNYTDLAIKAGYQEAMK